MADPIREAAAKMAERLRAFKDWSRCEAECGNQSIWESLDESALNQYEEAVKQEREKALGVPLPLEYAEAS